LRFKLFFLSLFICVSSFSQHDLDSLWSVWSDSEQADTNRLEALKIYAWEGYLFYDPDSAYYYSQLQYDYAEEKGLYKYMAKALNTQGVSRYLMDDVDQAIALYQKSVDYFKKAGDEKGAFGVLNNIGNTFYDQGNFDEAIRYYKESRDILYELKEEETAIKVINNLGMVYSDKGDYSNAMDHFNEALTFAEKYNNKAQLVISLNNIGILYSEINEHVKAIEYFDSCLVLIDEKMERFQVLEANQYNNLGNEYGFLEDYTKSLEYYNKSLEVKKRISDEHGMASTLFNIADNYFYQNQFDLSLEYASESIKIFTAYEDPIGIIDPTRLLANIYFQKGQNQKAIEQGIKALVMAQEYEMLKDISISADLLMECYLKIPDYKKAFDMQSLAIESRSKIQSEENEREILSHQYRYAYEKKAVTDSLKAVEGKILAQAKIETQQAQLEKEKTQRYALYGGVGLLLFFGGFMYNRVRVTQKQKDIIEVQKNEVEQQKSLLDTKNQEIVDSIVYAKRIQSAILPPARIFKESLKESFILYKPKDVVAGDFYWIAHHKDWVLFAAADCTGHGVPGAMVSVVCNNALNRAVREYGLSVPGEILNKAREIVVREFEKADEDVQDGMDIALCALNGTTLHYAGANIPLVLIRNGEIEVIKADKQPIGKYIRPTPYTTHQFKLEKGDRIYILSDGYVDQFGGPAGKKFKAKAFRELLLSIQDQTMDEQKSIIEATFIKWIGNLEQVDDVCVIGCSV
jgi:serine phosphatase RsbU (regulator of sigma subunit)/Tfp pilus assembly protein PilF